MAMTDEIERATDELRGAKNTLHAFVLVYANVGMDGERLYQTEDIKEVLLFQVWLKACAELGIQCPAPVSPAVAVAAKKHPYGRCTTTCGCVV